MSFCLRSLSSRKSLIRNFINITHYKHTIGLKDLLTYRTNSPIITNKKIGAVSLSFVYLLLREQNMSNEESSVNTCCFIGHREIQETEELKEKIYSVIENLILNKNVDTFLFGSKSCFNSLCYEQVTKIKEKYPHIKRIYVRAEFPEINESYQKFLLQSYEETYYSLKAVNAGKAVYVERNRDMINKSKFCIIYFQKDYLPENRKSGTKIAFDYAIKKNKNIIVLP